MHKKLIAVGSLVLLSACNTTQLMKIPEVETPEAMFTDVPTNKQPAFVLSKIVANIKRGTPIAHYPGDFKFAGTGIEGGLCNHYTQGEVKMVWGTGSSQLGNWSTELGEVFYEVMSNAGYNVAGNPGDLFGQNETASSAEFSIGGRIKEIRGNICSNHSRWDGRPLGTESGEIYVDMEWTIYSNLMRAEVETISTKGYNLQAQPIYDGTTIMFHNAFASSAENLSASAEFKSVFLDAKTKSFTNTITGSVLTLPKISERTKPLGTNVDEILSSVVTVRVGIGHGSGFVVNADGYVLTNAHVVGASKQATIKLDNGLEIIGDVINVNKQRDTALIKVPLKFPDPLPIRDVSVAPLEQIFVIGSPIQEDLQSTITTGIISVVRKNSDDGLSFIQSDAAVSPGNSGGPMLDENGNVVGISVAKVSSRLSEGLNLFIPIKDALNSLNIKMR